MRDTVTLSSAAPLHGRIRVPGDKSISHRALLLGALADGASQIRGFLPCGDCQATLSAIQALGVRVEVHDATTLTVHGRGLRGLRPPDAPLDCARSGTTMRLLAGILAGQPFASTLTGAGQLLRRPMRRVVAPLRRMGAAIADTDAHAPLSIRGQGTLRGVTHDLAVASAQVKSAILLAGLYAHGPTVVRQPGPARDHTERMLEAMGAEIASSQKNAPRNDRFGVAAIRLSPSPVLAPLDLCIPGDLSSAAFPLLAAALVPGSAVTIDGVGVNPTRTGLLDVLRDMGADVTLTPQPEQGNEPVASLTVRAAPLHGVTVHGERVVRMIDEFPILAVAATQAHGTTVVRDAAELRVKETDRIATVAGALRAMGAQIDVQPDGFVIHGPTALHGARVDSHGDHRLAMALVVAGMVASGETVVRGTDCIADSFPGFFEVMKALLDDAHAKGR